MAGGVWVLEAPAASSPQYHPPLKVLWKAPAVRSEHGPEVSPASSDHRIQSALIRFTRFIKDLGK